MLVSLHIENIAVIRKLTVDLDEASRCSPVRPERARAYS